MIQKIKKEDDSDDKILDNHDAGENFSARTRKVRKVASGETCLS